MFVGIGLLAIIFQSCPIFPKIYLIFSISAYELFGLSHACLAEPPVIVFKPNIFYVLTNRWTLTLVEAKSSRDMHPEQHFKSKCQSWTRFLQKCLLNTACVDGIAMIVKMSVFCKVLPSAEKPFILLPNCFLMGLLLCHNGSLHVQ